PQTAFKAGFHAKDLSTAKGAWVGKQLPLAEVLSTKEALLANRYQEIPWDSR
ncbi:hypothetical protein PHLCEN_2v3083, partial [Hermanssonia centrifuga]